MTYRGACILILASGLLVHRATGQSPADSVRLTFRTHEAPSPVQFVPGQFNGWGPNSGGAIASGAVSQMTYDGTLAAWVKTYTFRIHAPGDASRTLGDSVYQYKFNRGGGGSGWYPDPLNPEQNPTDNNNSILRLSRLFWFEVYPSVSGSAITRITAGLVHANSDTITTIRFSTAETQASALTTTDVTASYNEGLRLLDFAPAASVAPGHYIRLVAVNNHGDSVVFAAGGYAVAMVPMPSYARHGVTPAGPASNDSTTFRFRVPNKPFVLLRVAPVGQSPATSPAVLMRRNPGTSDWWVNLKLPPNAEYQYLYEIENNKQIYDPWGRWNGTNGSRFSTGAAGLTADDYVWRSTSYQRPPLNRLVVYELHIGEFAGGYYGLAAGQATFGQFSRLMGHFDSLGVNAIELMPVNDYGGVGPSGHSWGYDLNSWFALEPSYGTPGAFKALVDSAHAHGIAVILDVVFNHLNDTSPLWQMLPSEPENPYFKYATDRVYNEDGLQFFRDMDHWAAETQELVYAVLKMWIDEYRVDGFRYDYTQGIGWNVNEPAKGILGWANRIAQEYGNQIYQIAEHLPESPALIYYSGLTGGWHDSFRDKVFDEARFQNVTLTEFDNLVLGLGAFPGNDTPSSPSAYGSREEPVNHTVNHDEQSLIFEMRTWQGVPESTAVQRDKLYGTFMFTSLGIPMLWQGMEFAEPRGWASDGLKLTYRPVQWGLLGTARGQGHFAYYRALARQRRLNPALYRGNLRNLFRYNESKVLVWGFEDPLGAAKVMAIANMRGVAATVRSVPWLAAGPWYDIFTGVPFDAAGTTLDSLTIPAYTALVYSNIPEDVLMPVQEPAGADVPVTFHLAQNFPNPFNPGTTMAYGVSEPGRVRLAVYDMLGREVAVLVDEERLAGRYTARFDAGRLASGVYLCRLAAGGRSATIKITLLK